MSAAQTKLSLSAFGDQRLKHFSAALTATSDRQAVKHINTRLLVLFSPRALLHPGVRGGVRVGKINDSDTVADLQAGKEAIDQVSSFLCWVTSALEGREP